MVTNRSARLLAPAFVISIGLAFVAVFALGASGAATGTPNAASTRPTIVLVHGDWADGSSSWNGVIDRTQTAYDERQGSNRLGIEPLHVVDDAQEWPGRRDLGHETEGRESDDVSVGGVPRGLSECDVQCV
jgi:hypothetical protein